MKVARAFRNMLIAAARDPIWAIGRLLAAPVLVVRPVVYTAIAAGIVGVVSWSFAHHLARDMALPPHSVDRAILDLLALVPPALIAFYRLTAPMVQHFGDRCGDTRGTARFDSATEANAFLLTMLRDHAGALGIAAQPDELTASAARSEALLAEKTAQVAISTPVVAKGRVGFDVAVTNLTGHKFPTAYPARRAWLHVAVRDASGKLIFESGALRPDGSIVGNDNDGDPGVFEPHYRRITESGQVQVYESIMGDFKNRVTTGLLYGTHYLKDNRILPKGFDKATAGPRVAVVGDARTDPAFVGGSDTIRYEAPISGSGPHHVTVELWYESTGHRWAHNLDPYQADELQRFTRYYVQQANTAGKLVASAKR